jgi:hypothetical protein
MPTFYPNMAAADYLAALNALANNGAMAVRDAANTFTDQNTFAIGTITTSKPLAVTQTWNDAGVTFTGFDVNITDTASAAGSFLANLRVAGASKFSVNKAGDVVAAGTLKVATGGAVGGATPGTGGLAFPAVAVAVADANTLDDYEEGSWAPNQGAGLTVVGAFSSNGQYTKIGRKVTVQGQVIGATSVACSVTGIISSNLPFTANAGAAAGAGSATNNSAAISVGTYVSPSTTSIYATTAIAATVSIIFTATYFV